mmetsp:Transcript_23382/g.35917  ORF Transcript_23382/g.35917 Transcript_23382/m.35917 type:complete len:112 (-) Transcript_23382:640-975(-)
MDVKNDNAPHEAEVDPFLHHENSQEDHRIDEMQVKDHEACLTVVDHVRIQGHHPGPGRRLLRSLEEKKEKEKLKRDRKEMINVLSMKINKKKNVQEIIVIETKHSIINIGQ